MVAWDPHESRHRYLENADLAFEADRIVYVGRDYRADAGAGDETIDGRGMMIIPGLVDIHSHLAHEPINKGYTDETGSRGLYNSNLYEYMPTMVGDEEAAPWQTRLASAELLMSGVTTVVDLTIPYPNWIDTLAESGIRACIAPMFRSARWFTRNGHVVEYDWLEDRGFGAMEKAAVRSHCSQTWSWLAPVAACAFTILVMVQTGVRQPAQGAQWIEGADSRPGLQGGCG